MKLKMNLDFDAVMYLFSIMYSFVESAFKNYFKALLMFLTFCLFNVRYKKSKLDDLIRGQLIVFCIGDIIAIKTIQSINMAGTSQSQWHNIPLFNDTLRATVAINSQVTARRIP